MSLHLKSAAILLALVFPVAAFADPERPNIVFILADDLGINDLGCYGRKEHPTPNLDKLASQGMRFTSAYAAASVCSPTRASILTGKSPARLHLTTFLPGRGDAVSQMLLHPNIEQKLPDDVSTLADRLKRRGYASACIGKWHLGGKGCLPTDRGFDLYYPGTALTKPSATEGGKGEYELTAQAEKFVEGNKDRPFFLYLCHNNPHVALAAKDELIAKHKNAFNPIYAAMIETLDDSIGRLLTKLDELKLTENTIVIFMSDNGGLHVLEVGQTATYNRPFRAGKGFLYEGGVRVPMIVRWPGKIKAGEVVDTAVISTDWTPTLLALAGAASTESFDGINLADLFLHGNAPLARPLFWHQPHYMNQGSRPSGAVREGVWKLIEHYETGQCELFNLGTDLGETTDLSGKEPARVADLRGKLEKWRRDVNAQENLPNPKFNGKLARALYRDVDVSSLAMEEKAASISSRLEPWRKLMNSVPTGPKKKSVDAESGVGVVILHGRDAKVHGAKLRYENPPQKDTLGFWVVKDDWVEWKFMSPSAGKFEVEILQAAGKGSGGAEIEIAVAGRTLTTKVLETGHFQRFVPRVVGVVELTAGEQTLTVRAKTRPGGAVMDLRRVVLRDPPE